MKSSHRLPSANISPMIHCRHPNTPKGAKPVGLKPCPSLASRGGVWRFDAHKTGQKFPADGARLASCAPATDHSNGLNPDF